MTITTHNAHIVGPVPYRGAGGMRLHLPIGPCRVEQAGARSVDIVCDAPGPRSAALPVEELQAAQDCGHLLLLD